MRLGLHLRNFARAAAFSAARRNAAFGQQLKPQCACYGCCFYQTNVDNVTQPVHGTAARSDQRMARLVVVEIFSPKRADRDETVGAGVGQFDEQAGTGDAGDAALKGRPNAIGEKMRDQAVGGLALGLHGSPLGDGNLGRDLAEGFRRLGLRQRAFAQPQAADQRAMHDKIGIPADW